ncbi:hypothetical protein ACVOMS_35290 (plasmid) [Bradyrhizobium guangxiense]|uniref:hypothetical protein n=1 Tax=Bradyrhizobium guangxiense TaxID=1325115 RepID=UPI0037045E66
MAGRTNTPFDPRDFLANVGEGKTILEFGKGDVIFSQGDEANTIFYIQKGRVPKLESGPGLSLFP